MKSIHQISDWKCFLLSNRHTFKWFLISISYIEIIIYFTNALSSDYSMPNCTSVYQILESRGINSDDIPRKPINEIVLRYCELSHTGTCCTYNMEVKLAMMSRLQLDKSVKESIGKLHSVLGTRAQKFNDFFMQLLVESKKGFHAMFKRTYGIIYEQNAYVFSDFFTELETYFARGKIDLTETMDSFFNTLYQKLFTVLNAQYTFDDKYLGCISEHMKELKPFGDVPDKLSVQIKRSFVATRTYVQALSVAADVAKNMINIRPTADCTTMLTKMNQCGLCKGYTEKPCANYCVNVIKSCLQYYNDLDDEWDNFVSSMEKVSDRLLGPFNIVMVVEPINIKISEAIMNFQETGQEITKQVFQGCGKPVLGIQKRHISYDENLSDLQQYDNQKEHEKILNSHSSHIQVKRETTQSITDELLYKSVNSAEHVNLQSDSSQQKRTNKKQNNKKKSEDPDVNKEPVLDKLIKDIRQKVKDSKKFWSNLPYQICNNENLAVSPGTDSLCWDGNTVYRNSDSALVSHVSQTVATGTGTTPRQTLIIGNQLFYLKTAINNLRNAYNGQDVEWSDQEESYYGSGSGSGNGVDYEDETGSGLGTFENISPHSPQHTDSSSVHTINGNNSMNTIDSKHSSSTSSSSSGNTENKKPSKKSGGGANSLSKISLRRALMTYLLPICVAWLGGAVSDLL